MSNINKTKILQESPERDFNVSETFQLLKMDMNKLMCWGSRNFTIIKDKALFFRVSGMLFNGWVLITLAWDDTYTVRLVSTQWNVKQTITDVYFDCLTDTIDKAVERK